MFPWIFNQICFKLWQIYACHFPTVCCHLLTEKMLCDATNQAWNKKSVQGSLWRWTWTTFRQNSWEDTLLSQPTVCIRRIFQLTQNCHWQPYVFVKSYHLNVRGLSAMTRNYFEIKDQFYGPSLCNEKTNIVVWASNRTWKTKKYSTWNELPHECAIYSWLLQNIITITLFTC